jgi:hypothetical protein
LDRSTCRRVDTAFWRAGQTIKRPMRPPDGCSLTYGTAWKPSSSVRWICSHHSHFEPRQPLAPLHPAGRGDRLRLRPAGDASLLSAGQARRPGSRQLSGSSASCFQASRFQAVRQGVHGGLGPRWAWYLGFVVFKPLGMQAVQLGAECAAQPLADGPGASSLVNARPRDRRA